jgi:hypothetical protein
VFPFGDEGFDYDYEQEQEHDRGAAPALADGARAFGMPGREHSARSAENISSD